jgi:hypothetical protein
MKGRRCRCREKLKFFVNEQCGRESRGSLGESKKTLSEEGEEDGMTASIAIGLFPFLLSIGSDGIVVLLGADT